MTKLKKPIARVTQTALDASFGPDRNRPIVITITPGNGKDVQDTFTLRPHGTRRAEVIAVIDCYRFALRCRVNKEVLERARQKKALKQAKRERESIKRAERRLVQ